MLICPPHIPQRRVEAAVERIRVMRGIGRACPFPDDLGCETQLYLGRALCEAFPQERIAIIAQCCGVGIPDALFFQALVDIATFAQPCWMKPEIVAEAKRILLGLPKPAQPQPKLISLSTFPRAGLAGALEQMRGRS